VTNTPAPPGPPLRKPLLRGVSHQISCILAVPIALWLVLTTPDARAARHALVYGVTLVALFGVSAAYHRKHWLPVARERMRRLDHATIFLFIAGTYTPICLDGIGGTFGSRLVLAIWLGALVGVAQTLFWPKAPRVLHVGIYVLLGWAGLIGMARVHDRLGLQGVSILIVGGVLYTIGAVVYGRKRPDPFPTVFGYHEIFHALVIIAGGCLFEVVRRCLHVAS
jgi:hemolysin III